MPLAKLLKEYDTSLDARHRITVRRASKKFPVYKNYHICLFGDGRILLEPRVLVNPKLISQKTLEMMDMAMKNFFKKTVSEPLDLKEMKEIADALPD